MEPMGGEAHHMGLTLSLTEEMSMASDFATIVGFISMVVLKTTAILPSQTRPLLNILLVLTAIYRSVFLSNKHDGARG